MVWSYKSSEFYFVLSVLKYLKIAKFLLRALWGRFICSTYTDQKLPLPAWFTANTISIHSAEYGLTHDNSQHQLNHIFHVIGSKQSTNQIAVKLESSTILRYWQQNFLSLPCQGWRTKQLIHKEVRIRLSVKRIRMA